MHVYRTLMIIIFNLKVEIKVGEINKAHVGVIHIKKWFVAGYYRIMIVYGLHKIVTPEAWLVIGGLSFNL